MKVVILAGGLGTRISEETHLRPKPMIEVGGRPILWHIMKIYAAHGLTDFIVCAGYRGYMIKEYFANYRLHRSDVTVDLSTGAITHHASSAEPWKVTIIDTGEDTMTGGRVRRVRSYLKPNEPFCLTYGDGVTDLNIKAEIAFHKSHGKDATVAAVVPPGRYGALAMKGNQVESFTEKPPGDNALINGGFFVLHPRVIDRIASDDMPWEAEPLQGLAHDGQLMAFTHPGFWQPMDTLRDKNRLEQLWDSGTAPWKVWDK
jgi:glucose-1-phosphate cytidylyltransferase